MRIRVLSDLHFEKMGRAWRSFVKRCDNDCDVLVLSGDVTSLYPNAPGLDEVLRAFSERFRHVVYVPGNHEYYGGAPADVARLNRCCPNVHWLNNSSAEIDGVRFLGGTLWYRRPETDEAKWAMNDYDQIVDFEPWVYEECTATQRYLQQNLRRGDVLVTHHLPSWRSVHPKYALSPLNKFFVCDIEDLIRDREPALAIHGHTHESCDYKIGPTRVVCNPYGYDKRLINPAFDRKKTVKL